MAIKQLAEHLQVDKPLVYAIGARIWQSVSGPLSIFFLIRSLSVAEQGVYYALSSILGIQMFFELGLYNLLISQAGHQFARFDQPSARLRMAQLIRASSRWFGWAAVLFAMTALPLGWSILSGHASSDQWQWPLLMLVILSAITVAVSPLLAILEGAGNRESIYQSRLAQMIMGNAAVWSSLSLGLGYWALVAAAGVQLFWTLYLPCVRHRDFFQLCKTAHADASQEEHERFSWLRDVLPMQWRMALSSGIYHLATQFFTVIVLTFRSEAEAGRLGMTLSLTGAIQSLALAWINTKFSVASTHHGAGDRETAGIMWRRTTVISLGLLVIGLATATSIVAALPWLGRGIELRFLEPWQIVVLSIGIVATHIIAAESFYVVSRGARPFLWPALIGHSLTAIGVVVFGYLYGTTGVIAAYSATVALITLPLYTLSYLSFRR